MLPVIIFSASTAATDLKEAYRIGVLSYVVKPCRLAEHEDAIRIMLEYWEDALEPSRGPLAAVQSIKAHKETIAQGYDAQKMARLHLR